MEGRRRRRKGKKGGSIGERIGGEKESAGMSCWWNYSWLSGLRFDGNAITECQYRPATAQPAPVKYFNQFIVAEVVY